MATYNIAVKTKEGSHIEIPSNVIIPTRYMEGDVIAIADEAFKGCKDLISIILPQNTIRIGKDAFNGCTGLTFIDIPAKVAYMGEGAFVGCSSLEKINVNAAASSLDWPQGWNGGVEVQYLPETIYTITVNKTGSGTVNVKPSAIKGEEITISLNPSNGYIVSSVIVNGDPLEAIDGQYKFTMPGENVAIRVAFIEVPAYVSYDNISFDTDAIHRVDPFDFGGAKRTGYVAEITVKGNAAFIYTPTQISNLQYYDTSVSKWKAVASGSGWTLADQTETVTINNNTLTMYKHTYSGSSAGKLEYRLVEAI